jgi:hypothetical protein
MFASVDGANPGYMALAPHILAPRHVSSPSILGNSPLVFLDRTGWPLSAEAPTRMDGGFPECMAKMPSTLR